MARYDALWGFVFYLALEKMKNCVSQTEVWNDILELLKYKI